MRTHRGFTLLEVVVVMGIIAILAALALPAMTERAMQGIQEQVGVAFDRMRGLQSPVTMMYATSNQCPDNSAAAIPAYGIAQNTAYSGLFANKIDTGGSANTNGGCTIRLNFKEDGVHRKLAGKHLSMQLFGMDQGVVKWSCYTDVEPSSWRMIPKTCRFSSQQAAQATQAPET